MVFDSERRDDERTHSKHYRNPLKILEPLFFSLVTLGVHSEFPGTDDFEDCALLLDCVISILGLRRAKPKL